MRQSLSVSLLRKLTTKIFSLSTALVLAFTSLSSAAPLLLAQQAFAANSGDVWIVAAMPNPSNSGTEYVTLKNTSSSSVSLNNWSVVTTSSHLITTSKTLAPGSEVTICDNSAKDAKCDSGYSVNLVLPNSDMTIALRDNANPSNLIDQVTYTTAQITTKGQEVQFHTVSYNPTITPQEFTTISDTTHYYKGIDVGFSLNNDFGTLTGITVKLYSGSTLIGTNTAAQPMLDYYKNGGRSFTTPFVIQKGAYDPATDMYWTFSSYNWDKNNAPTKVVISATGSNGSDTKENDMLTFGGGSFDSLFPADTTAPDVPTLASPSNGAVLNNQNGPDFNFEWNSVSDPSGVTYDWESSLSSATNGTDGGFTNPLPYQHYGLTDTFLSEGESGEGTYYWQVRACDGASNCSAWSAPWKVTVDNTAPVVIVTPAAGNLLHGTATFNITVTDNNALDPSLNTSVWVYLYDVAGNQKHEGAKIDLSNGYGTFTVDTTQLDDGTANLDVGIVTDAAGNPSGAVDNYFEGYVIDNTAPVVSLSSPADGSYLQGSANPVIGSVQDGHLLGAAVLLMSGTVPNDLNDLLAAAPSGDILGLDPSGISFQSQNLGNLDTTRYADGAYTLVLGAVDQVGNIGWDLSYVTIDNTAPTTPTLSTPSNRSYVKTNDFYFNWNASLDASPVTYEFITSQDSHETNGVLDSGVWDNLTNGNAEQKNLTTPTIHSTGAPDGIWYWQVRAIDAAGNKSGWSDVWHVTIDTHAPSTTIAISHLSNGYVNTRQNGNVLTVTGTANDNLALNRVYVQLIEKSNSQRFGGQTINLIPDGTSGNWQAVMNAKQLGLPNGEYYAVATVTDMAGDSTTTDFLDFTLDNTQPTVAFTAPTPTNNAYVNGNFTVGYEAHDNYQLKSVNVSLFDTNASHSNHWVATCYSNGAEAGTDDSGTCTVKLPANLPDGTYYVQVGAQDQALNWSVNAVRYLTIDRTAPANPALVSPDNGAVLNGKSVAQSWSDSSNDVDHYIYESYNDANATSLRFHGTYTTTSKTATNVGEVTYWWRVMAIDHAGNTSGWSPLWKITIDNTAPNVPTAAMTDANNDDVTNGYITTKDFTFNLSDSSSDVTRYQLKYWNDIPGDQFNGENNAWNPTDVTLGGHSATLGEYVDQFTRGEGVHRFAFSACDAAGNCSDYSAPFTVTYDATAPTTPVANPAAGTYTGAQQITLTSSDSLSGLAGIYYTTDGSTPSKTNGMLYTSAFTVSNNKTVKAIAYDNAGNASDIMVAAYVINHPVAPQVLGASTDNTPQTDTNTDGHVLGDSTTTTGNTGQNKGTNQKDSASDKSTDASKSGAFLGLGWWWLAVLALLFILFLFILGRRSDSDEKA